MAKLSLSEVSKQFSIDRSTIYRAVKNGRLSRSSDGNFDIAEVIRCFGEPMANDKNNEQQSITIADDATAKLIKNLENEVKKYQEREERLMQQIDRMQTLLELKTVAPTTAAQQQDTTARNTHEQQQSDIPQTIDNIKSDADKPQHATAAQQKDAAANHSMQQQHAILQPVATQQQKKRGILNRLVNAIFDND